MSTVAPAVDANPLARWRGWRVRPRLVIVWTVLLAGGITMVMPIVFMLSTSFKDASEVYDLNLIPREPTLDNYVQLFEESAFVRWFLNSLIVATASTVSVVFFDSLVGYALCKFRFRGRGIVFIGILSTLMIPTEMLVIPWYTMSAWFGWIDTYWGIMFPGLMSAFGVFLMRQFMAGVPDELLDAGRIDGVSEFGLFTRVAVPLVRPALAALCIFTFLGNWNAFLWPLVVIQTPGMRTLPVGIALFSGEAGSSWHLIMAASALAVLPVLGVFVLLQRQIIEGIVLTGLRS